MTFAIETAKISRTPVQMVTITMPFCTRVFGTSPCDAVGVECYNTFETCIFTSAWDTAGGKSYRFTSVGVPAPFNTGERPYLISVKMLPNEIKEVRTIVSRATIIIADEPDEDIGIDPYVANRSSVQGTYWKKWLTRNKYYKGRPINIKNGYDNIAETLFPFEFNGTIESIQLLEGRVVIEAVDLIHDFGEIYWPPKVDVRLTFDITDTTPYIYVDNISELQSPTGHILIDEEVIAYTTHNVTTRWVTGLTRGAKGTIAAAHSVDDKVTRMGITIEDDYTDSLLQILFQLGIPTNAYNVAALNTLWNKPNLNLPRNEIVLAKPMKLSDVTAQLCELGEVVYWVGESTQMDFIRRVPNRGLRDFVSITDEANIVDGSVSVNISDNKRITRMQFFWDFNLHGDLKDTDDYGRRELIIDADAESDDEYSEESELIVLSPFVRLGQSYTTSEDHYNRIVNYLKRYVWFNRDPREIITLRVELKDLGIKTGSYVRLTTNHLQDRDGVQWTNVECQVIKRELLGPEIKLTLRRQPRRRIAYIAPDGTPDFSSADDDNKQYAFIANNTPNEGRMNNGNDDGYYII